MTWDAFKTYRGTQSEIHAATIYGAQRVLEAAPRDYFDLKDYLPAATVAAVELYGTASRDAAEVYLRDALRYGGSTPSLPLGPLDVGKSATAVAYWALTETGTGQRLSTEVLLPKLATGMTRIVRNTGRDAISTVVERDDEARYWQRVPQSGACAFCRMLSTKVYTSKKAASIVVGRAAGSTGKGRTEAQRAMRLLKFGPPKRVLRSGGSQNLGDSYHDHCQCEPYVYSAIGDRGLPDDVEYMLDDYFDEYQAAEIAVGNDYPKGQAAQAILAKMREKTAAA